MADVKITFEEVKTKANEIHTCNVNLDQALKDIKTNITSLDAQWTSDASDTIRGKIWHREKLLLKQLNWKMLLKR